MKKKKKNESTFIFYYPRMCKCPFVMYLNIQSEIKKKSTGGQWGKIRAIFVFRYTSYLPL